MEITNAQRAEVLVHALPYIKKYNRKIVVVKYGGNAMISPELKNAVMGDIVLLSTVGVRVVLVHGGGPEINDVLSRIGKVPQFVDGLRVTDEETMDVVKMVLCGKVNKNLVSLLEEQGGRAVGLCGIDGGMIRASKRNEHLGLVGDIMGINAEIIIDVLDKGYIPVIATVGRGSDGTCYNINADTAAAKIAVALGAESLVSMTDISGIMRDKDDPSSLLSRIEVRELPELIKSGVISGGMIPKVECCAEAIEHGVRRVFIIDGRVPHSILIETMTDEGIGTMVCAS